MRPIWQEKAICFAWTDGWAYSRKLQFPGGMTSQNLSLSSEVARIFSHYPIITKTLLQEDHVFTTALVLGKVCRKSSPLEGSSSIVAPSMILFNQNHNYNILTVPILLQLSFQSQTMLYYQLHPVKDYPTNYFSIMLPQTSWWLQCPFTVLQMQAKQYQ